MKTAGVNVFFDAINGNYLPKLQKHLKLNKESVKINHIADKMEKEQKYPQSDYVKMTFNPQQSSKDTLVYDKKYLDVPNGFYARVELFGKDDKLYSRTQRLKHDPDTCKYSQNETVGSPIVRVVSEKYNGNYIKY